MYERAITMQILYAVRHGLSRGGDGAWPRGGQLSLQMERRYALRSMAQERLFPLPDLSGRLAVLGGQPRDRTELCLSLALRQARQHGVVVCLDAHGRQQLEMPFRLLLREDAAYIPLPAEGTVSDSIAQQVLQTLQAGLGATPSLPPLLIIDGAQETTDWEHTLTFFLRTGTVVVELLPHPACLVFGRYETTLLLRTSGAEAEAISQTVGRKVTPEDLEGLQPGEGYFIHLARVYRVRFPERS